jgi:LysM repeat protein
VLGVFFVYQYAHRSPRSSGTLPDTQSVLGVQKEDATPNNYYYYDAQPGDSLFSISEKFQINWETVVQLNSLKEPFTVSTGQKIRLPANAQTTQQQFYDNLKKKLYVVEAGDSFVSIAQKVNASVNELLSANPELKSPQILHPGQILRLP